MEIGKTLAEAKSMVKKLSQGLFVGLLKIALGERMKYELSLGHLLPESNQSGGFCIQHVSIEFCRVFPFRHVSGGLSHKMTVSQ